MKPSTDQLITWFFTASAAAQMHPPEAEAGYREALAKIKGKERSGIASGVKQGVNDLLHMADMWPLEKYEAVEAALLARGLLSLEKMQATLSRKHIAILKRGDVRNEEEYHIVAEMLRDMSSDLTDDQRQKLGTLTTKFEDKIKRA
jgi:hypothetical protein